MRRIISKKIRKLALKKVFGTPIPDDTYHRTIIYDGTIREYRDLKHAYNRRPNKNIPFAQWALTV